MTTRRSVFRIFATLLLALDASGQADVTERKLGDIWFEPFKFTFQSNPFSVQGPVEGELGRLVVSENRTKPDSRLIELAFVRLKSTATKPGYPVVYLDGGPGSSAINLAHVPDYMRAFQKLREVG